MEAVWFHPPLDHGVAERRGVSSGISTVLIFGALMDADLGSWTTEGQNGWIQAAREVEEEQVGPVSHVSHTADLSMRIGGVNHLVDVSLCVGEVSNEGPGAEKGPEDAKADDVCARVVPRGPVEVGVILEALAVVRFGKWPLALLFPALSILAPRRMWRDLVEVGHGCACACAGSPNQFDGHGKVAYQLPRAEKAIHVVGGFDGVIVSPAAHNT